MKSLVFDLETDPFEYGERPGAFLAGICDGIHVRQWWSDEIGPSGVPRCIESFLLYLAELREPHYVYAHNGGKFDFFFLPGAPLTFENPKIVNGRVLEMSLNVFPYKGALARSIARHRFRDSFAIMPFALDQYRKEEIDYGLFRKNRRDKAHARGRIMRYHRTDLIALQELVAAFIHRFGPRLTIASTAMREINKRHPTPRQSAFHDQAFRKYYFGGRVQAFQTGTLRNAQGWQILDVNSMYPFVMANYLHPRGNQYEFNCDLATLLESPHPGFASVRATSRGAFPIRTMEGVSYPDDDCPREFHITLHELRQAHRLQLVQVHDVAAGYLACDSGNFAAFVSEFAEEKRRAKLDGDRIGYLFAKFVMNSGYGKFATNPANHWDYRFVSNDDKNPRPQCSDDCPRDCRDAKHWRLYEDWGFMGVWRRPSAARQGSYYDVAIGASITGAARAELMAALHLAIDPVYCDTDSIICTRLDAAARLGDGLGEWKVEGAGDTLLACGKKLYCLTDGGRVIKQANKGVQMDLKDFRQVVGGGVYTYRRDAPTFRRDGGVDFVQRRITKRS